MIIDTTKDLQRAGLILSPGNVDCPSCKGLGEFQESYRIKGPAAQIIDCPDCLGAGYVTKARRKQLRRRGKPRMPKGWTR